MRLRRPFTFLFCAVPLAVGLAVSGCADSTEPAGNARESVSQYVDPFIGTGGHGHTYPGATVPFGMVQLSPDNGVSGWDWTSGYHFSDSVIVGFSHTHLTGTGIGDLGDIQLMPVPERVDLVSWDVPRDSLPRASRFSHDRERAEPGYYAVDLESGVGVELTATARVGVHRYAFPASGAGPAPASGGIQAGASTSPGGPETALPSVVLDLGYAVNWDAPTETLVQVVSDTLITGYRLSRGWARDQRVYFAAVFSHPIASHRLLTDSTVQEATWTLTREPIPPTAGERTKAVFSFDLDHPRQLLVKVGISGVSVEGALANLRAEVPDWDFDRVRVQARHLWENELSRVRIQTDDTVRKRVFYTALYHTKLAPVLFSDVDGRYRGGDGDIHRAEDFQHYAIFSLWDTFRAAHPLYTLTDSARVDDFIRTMLAFSREHGLLPVWELLGNETNTMTGNHAIPVIFDAYLKGFRGFDAEEAFEAMKTTAMQDHRGLEFYKEYGYIPSELEDESVTKTLEYAFNDWCIAQMARALGHEEDYRSYMERARAWTHVLDPSTRFMRGKSADGEWVEPFDPLHASHREGTDYTEGNAWQHTWFVPHDVYGFIDRMGGRDAFVAKLDSLFESDTLIVGEDASPDISGMIGQYAHGNEPSHHIAYLYSFAGAPWKTQERVRDILDTQYRDEPDGISGNEDCGQMSAWYVLSALGFFPANPASGVYVIGSPLFPRAEVQVGEGRTFTVVAEGASPGNRYVQSASLDGEPMIRGYLHHWEVVGGGELTLVMGPEPNQEWGAHVPIPEVSTPEDVSAPPMVSDNWTDERKTQMADRVRVEFLHAWEGYRRFAWGHDALRPLSQGWRDWHDVSLYMTPLDGFDTMLLMGLTDEAEEAKSLVLEKLSFDHDFDVQVFEITIRLLGGLLSAYQMDGDPRFLDLATDLADRLLPAFESATGMPYVRVHLQSGERRRQVNNPAEIGTLMLELGTLSRITGNPIYYDTAKRAITSLFQRRSEIGLVGTTIDVETGEWQNTTTHVSGMIDSYYEYLLKAWLLFEDEDFGRMWRESIGAVNTYLADERGNGLWYGHADMNTGERGATRFGALDAFLPAVLALGGDLDRAGRLMESCFRMWTLHGIEPEQLDYATMQVVNPGYPLRPEALESAYYLYRLTGNERYLDMGRVMFESLVEHTRTETGYAHLEDVVTKEKADGMQSFFLAETLKYAYLLFAPPETLPFDEVIFNTEAHPLRKSWE